MIPFISEKFQCSFVLKERMYKSKETGGYGYMCLVHPGKQEGAERSGQVSLQRSLAFLLFFT